MSLILGVSAENPKKQEDEILFALSEAGYTCACCGIKSKPNLKGKLFIEQTGYMYLVVDDEGSEKAVCTLCYYTLNMDKLSAPRFIYYPWMSQEQINYVLHYVYTVLVLGIGTPAKKASSYILQLGNFSFHLNKFDPILVSQPLKLVHLLSWLQMEEPESYRARNIKYLKDIRLVQFTIPLGDADIRAAFQYFGTLMHEEKLEDKWHAVYVDYVKNRQKGLTA